MIYVLLKGRIGNQLFMYSFARALQKEGEKIVLDDAEVLKRKWLDSLPEYNLSNVEYVHSHKEMAKYGFGMTGIWLKFYHHFTRYQDYTKKNDYELANKVKNEKRGLFLLENGYSKFDRMTKNVLLDGYFQSEKYISNIRDVLLKEFSIQESKYSDYPGLNLIKSRNTVCISIKVQHNVGNGPYDVCNNGYYEKGIKYITNHIDNPLFFICSDNVDYVKEHLIDTSKYDVVCQSKDYPVSVSLAVMSKCKHFIIGNTTFGWWAQYLCEYPDKIVIAPSRWMNVDMPMDIYQNNWTLIEV